MAANKNLVRMVSTAKNKNGNPTGIFYVTSRNPKKLPEKLERMKYDPVVRQHVLFKERKIK